MSILSQVDIGQALGASFLLFRVKVGRRSAPGWEYFMDLVAGATGFVGKRIVLRLREKSHRVRALLRGGARRAEAKELQDAGAEVVDADLTRPETLKSACTGIETVLCTATECTSAPYPTAPRLFAD